MKTFNYVRPETVSDAVAAAAAQEMPSISPAAPICST